MKYIMYISFLLKPSSHDLYRSQHCSGLQITKVPHMQNLNFMSFDPLGAELQHPSQWSLHTLLPPLFRNEIIEPKKRFCSLLKILNQTFFSFITVSFSKLMSSILKVMFYHWHRSTTVCCLFKPTLNYKFPIYNISVVV